MATERPDGHPKVQHYVPKCLLRGFTIGDSDQLWVKDKQQARPSFRPAVKNVAAESGFYDLEEAEGFRSLEPTMGRLEDMVAPILQEIRSRQTLATCGAEDRVALAIFAVMQSQRTASAEKKLADMMVQLNDKARKIGLGFGLREEELAERMPGAAPLSPDDLKRLTLDLIVDSAGHAEHLAVKPLVLLRASQKHQFFLSDNPVALYNKESFGPFGNLGWAVPGIEVYLPIAPHLALWWLCPTIEERVRTDLAFYDTSVSLLGDRPTPEMLRVLRSHERLIHAIETGDPLAADEQNVLRVNSLEVRYSERFVFANRNEFDLVDEMIDKDPRYRFGPRGKVG